MSKIWIFGDSYSTPFRRDNRDRWQDGYIKWKGYKPKIFGDILGERFGYEVNYLSDGGICNDFIFERIYTNVSKIKRGDIIIIGWSSINRFRLALENPKWWNIVSVGENRWGDGDTYPNIKPSTIEDILVNRSLSMWMDELNKRKEFIQWLFKGNRVLHWSPFKGVCSGEILNPQTIEEETNGEVMDTHYSEGGHVMVSEVMWNLLNDKNRLIEFNGIEKRML